MLQAIWHVLTTVAMATDKHATIHNHATVEAFSLGSVPVMTSCNSRGSEAVLSLWSVHGLYSLGSYGTVPVTRVTSIVES
jgi:hypothetical protein